MRKRLSGVIGLLALTSFGCAMPAYAAPSATTPSTSSSTTSPSATDTDDEHAPLTPEELAEQIARAGQLREQLVGTSEEIKTAVKALEKASAKANKLLEAYSRAATAERAALAEADREEGVAAALQQRLDDGRQALREWAVDVYTRGGSWAESMAYLDALSKDASDAANPLNDLDFLTDSRIRSVEDLRQLAVDQKLASMKAEAAKRRAESAAATAKKAKNEAKKAVQEQTEELEALRVIHQEHIDEAGPLAGLLLGSGDDDAISASEALSEALGKAGVDVGDLKLTPCTTKKGDWPNGQIPPSALCKMAGSPDEFLVPDAAAAFNAMSRAYAKETGNLICVVDGYRSYAEQVVVKAERGVWAATPGTSEHGFGRAADLCGGIQDYGHPAHLWMKQNAPRYGWFHPAWAAQGGRLPEPWHWEYAG